MIPRMTFLFPVVPLVVLGLVAACAEQPPLDPDFLAEPNGPTTLTATAPSYNQINLAWEDNARSEGGWEVHRSTTGPSGAFSLLVGVPPNAVAASDNGLQGSTEYCYRVRSFRITGRRTSYAAFSNVACATTPAVPVPAAPSSLSATPRCCFLIDVTWTDNSTDESFFRMQRASSSSGPWIVVGSPSANSTSLTDYVNPEQMYCYRVVAVNIVGSESGPSNVDCTAIPAAPSSLAAAVSGGAVDLTWTDNSTLEDGFQVERSGAGAPGSVIATLLPNTTSYHDAGVTPNNTYSYTVRATRDGGTSANSQSVQVVVATTPPSPPTNVQLTPQSSSSVVVTWSDGSTNEQGFRVQRSTNGGATWTTAAAVGFNQQGVQDYGLSAETTVCYRVIAFNNAGDSPPSSSDCTALPARPTGFTATGVDAETVDFAWVDNSAVEDGYLVWGYQCSYYYYCYPFTIATLGPNTTSYRYRDPTAYWYVYAVVALKDGGVSDVSDQAYPTAPPSGSPARRVDR